MKREDIERKINELIESKRIPELRAFLFSNDPQVRKISVELMANNEFAYVSQFLCDLLGDPDESVRESVYKVTWIRERDSTCKYIIRKLKDEIDYGSHRGMLGPEKAKQAVKKLVEYAPDQSARDGILEHIREQGLSNLIER